MSSIAARPSRTAVLGAVLALLLGLWLAGCATEKAEPATPAPPAPDAAAPPAPGGPAGPVPSAAPGVLTTPDGRELYLSPTPPKGKKLRDALGAGKARCKPVRVD